MTAPIVFFDIAGPAELNLASFYTKVFGWEVDQTGQFTVPITTPMHGTFRADPAEKRIYLGVADVTATLAAVVDAGGKIDVPRFEVPGVVVLGLFRDPAGNPMGLVEMDGDRQRVP